MYRDVDTLERNIVKEAMKYKSSAISPALNRYFKISIQKMLGRKLYCLGRELLDDPH